ncbi:MAG: energy transducer TonB, partial [Thermodesulfovibrio sp.]|uniref:Energy transducer TonB n=2 Tax=Thermodesulfovibrio TaxID=28261 RepID=A0A2J6WGU7_9BACT|nr:MAG: energy transducer TonB [Thermodesulfovibrio aggregans]
MKKALLYSCMFHISLFIFILILQDYFRPAKPQEPVSVVIVPVTPQMPKFSPSFKTPPPKHLEKLPPIRELKQPKYLSAIPKGNQGQSTEKQKETASSGNLKTEKHFKELTPAQSPDIFDKDVIARLSRKHQKSKEVEQLRGLSFSAKEFNDWGYLERLKEKIERVWQYPPQAAERGIYGDLYIRFTINKKGKLLSVELVRTSGYRMLDDAAIKALKDAEPFWPLPDDWQKDSLTITGHFIYTLHGFYLR